MTTGGTTNQAAVASTIEPDGDDYTPRFVVIVARFGPLLIAALGVAGFFYRLVEWKAVELEWLGMATAGLGWAWTSWFPITPAPKTKRKR